MSHVCPYCHERDLETVASVPYVRGLVVAYTVGVKKFMGCRRCVRRAIYKEVGKSSVLGWFSITAAVINPVMLTYGAVRGLFVRPNPQAVRRALDQAGIPEDGMHIDPLRVAYGLAAAMIAADGKLQDEEVSVAIEIGRQLFTDFSADDFFRVLKNHKDLPGVEELAYLLGQILEDNEKALIYQYLAEIAASDGEVADEEQEMLERVRSNLGIRDQAAMSMARRQLSV
ncbi:TerB family tellurite resistance protein [Pseudenhygromyxa sp. WMMC2535]|uniref:tellurite resistance TerB family protein n=1 Tax=Pseudenhygromyxa sp. WMMC2535 TaxID=2712867 RepID=UPI00155684C0|nr:TerB family tellurite resistance protein [Pseudenhygromyxa sp. WMMC2535]NVB42488.1 TerB family tellurite resistance protein [Pseudenhygromyxa sp. WMMC2535]